MFGGGSSETETVEQPTEPAVEEQKEEEREGAQSDGGEAERETGESEREAGEVEEEMVQEEEEEEEEKPVTGEEENVKEGTVSPFIREVSSSLGLKVFTYILTVFIRDLSSFQRLKSCKNCIWGNKSFCSLRNTITDLFLVPSLIDPHMPMFP